MMRVQPIQVSPFSQRRYEGEIVLNPHSNSKEKERDRERREGRRGSERRGLVLYTCRNRKQDGSSLAVTGNRGREEARYP